MPAVQVRYLVTDVDAAITFYTKLLGFTEVMHPAPSFALLSNGELRLALTASNPQAGGGQPMPDGRQQVPGGWNRSNCSSRLVRRPVSARGLRGHFAEARAPFIQARISFEAGRTKHQARAFALRTTPFDATSAPVRASNAPV